jgi:hypothetical protein
MSSRILISSSSRVIGVYSLVLDIMFSLLGDLVQ